MTLSVTPNAAYQRARYADAKKRKRVCLEAEAVDDEESTTRGVSVPVLKTHTTYYIPRISSRDIIAPKQE